MSQAANSTPVTAAGSGPVAASDLEGKVAESLNAVGQQASKGWEMVVKYAPDAIIVLLMVALAWFLSTWARRAVRVALEKAKFDPTLTKFFSNLVKWLILAVAIVMVLGRFGIETATFAAVFGATGLAIGLALQGSLQHLAAGVMLLVFRPFKVGDAIVVSGVTGMVNEIDLFTTSIDTFDGRRIIVPNGQIFGSVIENSTHHPHRRADINITLSGSNDVARVHEVLLRAAKVTKGALESPPADVILMDLAGGNQNWSVQVWAKTTELGIVRENLASSVREALTREGIEGPRPMFDVNVVGLSGAKIG